MTTTWGGAVAAAIIVAAGAAGLWGGPAAGQSVAGENDRPPAAAAGNALAARQAQAAAQAKMAAHGEELFGQRCKSCHMPPVEHAPSRAELAAQFPNVIIDALKTGKMQAMASGLSDNDIASIAVFVTGQAPDAHFDLTGESRNACPAGAKFNPAGPSWNGWSPDKQNTRVAASTTITAANAPKLAVKWAFAYQGGRYGQPTVVGNRVFVTSSSGQVYALDKQTGCVAWSYKARGSVRVTVSVGKNPKAPSGWAAYFGDMSRNQVAVDANSGKELWNVLIDSGGRGILTGAPSLWGDTLYVPLSSFEEGVAGLAAYECCKQRGAVAAIDVATGKIKWKSYAIPTAPAPFKKNAVGTQMYGPAGAAIWSSPTIDPKRGVLYVATGDSYTDVEEHYSDAVEAMDLKTGKIRWAHQMTELDHFLVGCPQQRPGVNCPTPNGPDFDFGSSPILKHMPGKGGKGGKDMLFAGQKSGQVYGLDPDDGKIIWQTRIGKGSALGGVEWGMSADNDNLYVGIADRSLPSISALRLTDGALVWRHRAPEPKCSFEGRCGNGYSGPSSIANGVLFTVNQDGHIRAFVAKTGEEIWDYDTAGRHYETVNGVKNQRGGNLDATGMSFAGGMGFVMAGFNGASGSSGPDNVLLAFSVGGK
ncbi:PQQ-binding-like beta-propeller repeat protein [Phenylobacterium sp.]|uniref:outer membrane protein assembly factor BamB family protein n=1 Tax=Phenylobacterium sp. TaxID=1871053 RepID=UPI002BC19DBA|nr:PQQ-binding-like beta-propeller repeat protein [Phenylobacterium sp.]HLZ73406.1 PQQ-binding-like beta-propeller repeat protein [Phenylobacterium sp.]